MSKNYDVVVVGAGVSGIGVGIILRHLGVEKLTILERDSVGASFKKWPREMRFITPSFPSNQFGILDLNAVCIATSPGYSLGREHPTGVEYAHYLRGVAEHFSLPIQSGIAVCGLEKLTARNGEDKDFRLSTSEGEMRAKCVVWAAGEFGYPNLSPFEGAELCLHNSQVASWRELDGDKFIVLGGNESGVDAAFHLTQNGKRVRVLDARKIGEDDAYDPSVSLSPFMQERLERALESGLLELIPDARVARVTQFVTKSVTKNARSYKIVCENGASFRSSTQPILATGFSGSVTLVRDEFSWENGVPQLNAHDESTVTPNLFLCGPSVRHDQVIFCFIYKFRQRFAVVAHEIARRLNVEIDDDDTEFYRKNGMYLDDLSCCSQPCEC